MKKISRIIIFVAVAALIMPAVNAGVIKGGLKGLGKGVKSVAGCADRGVKGTVKGAKTAAQGTGKAVKTVF